jgi:hypothetical protein
VGVFGAQQGRALGAGMPAASGGRAPRRFRHVFLAKKLTHRQCLHFNIRTSRGIVTFSGDHTMQTPCKTLLLAFLVLPGCSRYVYEYDLKGALEHKEVGYKHQAEVAVVGSTNGPFRCLGAGGELSRGQPGKFAYAPPHGPELSWTAPVHHTNAYQSAIFENPSGDCMLVIRTVSN